MLHTIQQDITKLEDITDKFFILQVVNCKKKMNKGVALSLKTAYPMVERQYLNHFEIHSLL